MGRCNIQNPKTGKWRCWSTIVDDYVSEWMSEDQYKDWLVEEAANKVREELDLLGIRKSEYQTYAECEYDLALKKFCEPCDYGNCDNCDYNLSFEAYKRQGNNYFNIDM